MESMKQLLSKAGTTLSKNSPTILTSVAVAGTFTTAILAVKATPKALCLLDEERERRNKCGEHPMNRTDVVKTCWKLYIPSAAVGLTTATCIIAANTVNLRRNAAIAGLYSITETAFKEYQSKVVETIGSNKELKIHDEIAKEQIKSNPIGTNEVIITGQGEVLCYDSLSGRYFKSDIEKIRQGINEINFNLRNDMFVSLNDLYYELGLAGTKLGNELGWTIENGYVDVTFSSQLTEENKPCLVLNFDVFPKYN